MTLKIRDTILKVRDDHLSEEWKTKRALSSDGMELTKPQATSGWIVEVRSRKNNRPPSEWQREKNKIVLCCCRVHECIDEVLYTAPWSSWED